MADYDYETDPDIVAFKRKKKVTSELIPSKNPISNVRPDLQYHDYENDPDITAIARVRNAPQTTTETPGQFEQMFRDILGKGVGAYEAGLNLGSNALMQTVGGAKGIIQSIPEAIQKGVPPQPIAERIREQFVREHPPYQPVTPEAKQYLEAIGSVAEPLKIPPFMPEFLGMPVESKPLAQGAQTAKQQLQAQFSNLVPKLRIEKGTSGLQSAGAAATTNPAIMKANIDSAIAKFDPSSPVIEHISKQAPENVNVNALETRALEEKHGVDLLKSQRTNNLTDYVQSWNHREANGLASDFAQQPKQLAQAFEESKKRHAPRIHSDADASELGQHEINGLVEKDKQRQQNIQNKYLNLKNAYNEIKKNLGLAESEDLPLDGKSFVENAKKTLNQELFTEDSRKSIDELLNKIEDKNGVMTFQEFTTLDKRLSELSKFGKGSEKEAARLTRNHLNNMELTDDASPLYPLLKDAKNTAKERFDVIDSNPAYAKAIGEGKDLEGASSQGESLDAGKFHRKFVSTATPEAIRRLKAELPQDHIAHEAITYGELDRAKKAITNANESRVKSDQFANFLKDNKSILKESLSPEAMQDITEIGYLNSKIGKPDAGTFSHSNTYSAVLGDLAKSGLLTLGETALASKTAGLSTYPVSMAKKFKEKFDKNSFANEQRNRLGGLTKEQ